MRTRPIYSAKNGAGFGTAKEAIAYERPLRIVNDMLAEGKNLLEIFAVLYPEHQWNTEEEKILQSTTKDTEVYYRAHNAISPPLKMYRIYSGGKIGLMGEDKNFEQVWAIRVAIKQIFQFQPSHSA